MKINTSPLFRRGKGRLWAVGTLIGMTFLALVLVLGFLTGCPTATNNGDNGNGDTTPLPAFPITVTDQLGRTVTIEAEPQKIISLSPGNTEIVYALGLEDRLVGVTTYCVYPEAAQDKPKIGGFSTVEVEKVIEIQPDLVLAASIHQAETIPHLEALGLTIIAFSPGTLDEVLEALTLLGQVTGAEEKANEVVGEMESRIKAITDKTANLTAADKPSVFVHIFPGLYSAGSDKLIHELIVKAGGINIVSELTGYPVLSLEAIIDANPQIMLASIGHGSGEDATLQELLDEERLAGVDARLNDRVYGIVGDIINKPTPRIVDGLEEMARLFYPELFD